MRDKILLPLILAAVVLTAGAIFLGSAIVTNAQNISARTNAVAGGFGGFNYQNISYNQTAHVTINKGEVLKEVSTVAQCTTNFFDSAAPIASKALNISLNASTVNAANARLQANITENASVGVIRDNLRSFDSAQAELFWQAAGAARNLNQTQLMGLRESLNSSVQTLKTCVTSSNSTNPFHIRGLGFGFLRHFAFFRFHFRHFGS